MTSPRHRLERPPARPARRRLAAMVAAALAGAVALPSLGASGASYVDAARLDLGDGTAGSGIGFPYRFDIGLVLPNGTVEQADGPNGYDWPVPGAETLVPGHSVTTTIPVFNNTPTLNADTTLKIVLRNGDGQVAAGIPNITSFLRFTAQDSAGNVLFSQVPWSAASGSIGVLHSRDKAALNQADTYTPGAAGSEETITLTITYPDVAGVENYNGGQSALAVRFAAASVKP